MKPHLVLLSLVLISLLFLPSTFADDGDLTLAWDPPLDASGVSGYQLYWGSAPGQYDTAVDVGNATQCTVSGLSPGTYYFAVKAYGTAGEQSDFSNEVTARIGYPKNAQPQPREEY